MSLFKVATLADVHFNALPAEKMYEQLTGVFLEYIKNHEIDMIVLAGDYYDSIISFNSRAAYLSTEFIRKLVEVSSASGVKYIRIIKGTMSHDNNQLNNLKVFETNENVDFKIITTVTEEVIEGLKTLYIPEEYMKNVSEFYKDYFNDTKRYDMIFGHGMFKETSFVASKQESAVTLSGAPVFDSKAMCSICDGFINFGHIHTSCGIRNKITYVGSFSRWVFGEEEKKGFLVTIIDKETKEFNNEFIENTEADRYDTVTVVDAEKYNTCPEKLVELFKTLNKGKLRMTIIADGSKDCSYVLSFVRTYFATLKDYKLNIVDKSIVKREVEAEQQITNLMEKYSFVFDKKLPRQAKISKFIKVRDGVEVSPEYIKEELNIL